MAPPIRIRKRRVAGLLVIVVVIAAALGHEVPGTSSSTTASSIPVPHSEHRRPPREADGASSGATMVAPPAGAPSSEHRGALGVADGAVPDGTSVFDDDVPGVAKLDPALLGALRQAATDAGDDGVRFVVNSGWRSPEYQRHLLDDAISTYGSAEEAARWVATPTTSAHVSGDAVDIGPTAAAAWLSEHGAQYGLCRIYGNEPWHFELRPEAGGQGCPAPYADPTHDPRMQR
jgi:D-alanyl-D-alanine carboxypeptidase